MDRSSELVRRFGDSGRLISEIEGGSGAAEGGKEIGESSVSRGGRGGKVRVRKVPVQTPFVEGLVIDCCTCLTALSPIATDLTAFPQSDFPLIPDFFPFPLDNAFLPPLFDGSKFSFSN